MKYEFVEFRGRRCRPDELQIELSQEEQPAFLNEAGEVEHLPGVTYCTIYIALPGERFHLFSGPVSLVPKMDGDTAVMVILPH